MSAEMEEPELELEGPDHVQAIEDMDTEIFALHMENRHADSLAGLLKLWFSSDYVEDCYRAFHNQLHRFFYYEDHHHGDE